MFLILLPELDKLTRLDLRSNSINLIENNAFEELKSLKYKGIKVNKGLKNLVNVY